MEKIFSPKEEEKVRQKIKNRKEENKHNNIIDMNATINNKNHRIHNSKVKVNEITKVI